METVSAAQEFQIKLRAEAAELEKLASHGSTYPFLAKLTPIASELHSLADREWSHCLKHLPGFSEKLLDAKETTIDPLKQFYHGQKRTIYDGIRTFLRDEEPNFADVSGPEPAELREIMSAEAPYKGNSLQQARAKLDTLRTKVADVVTAARNEATARINQARASVEAAPEFDDLEPAEKSDVLEPFESALKQAQSERLAPVIRQIADRAGREILPRQLQTVAELSASKHPETESGGETKPAEYVSARSIQIAFGKAVIESEADLDAYLAALKEAYLAELEQHRRITL